MDKLCFSIDEERYDDRHGHVLSLVGWYMHPEKKKCIFQLLGDGYEVIDIPEIERYERPDVAQSLDVETVRISSGFYCDDSRGTGTSQKIRSVRTSFAGRREKHCFGSVRVMTWMNWSMINW